MLYWSQRQDVGPPVRAQAAVAYDAARQRTVLFGGGGASGSLADTWTWNGELWTQVADTGPSARVWAAAAFDAARQHVVLFGGTPSATAGTELGDTWAWDGSSWTQLDDTGPAPRHFAAMAYDSLRSCVVLFGGESQPAATQFGDTWEWNGTNWMQKQDVGPGTRSGHAMAFDGISKGVLLFGGLRGVMLGDTWLWDGTTWTQVAHFGPPARSESSLAAAGGKAILFGGLDAQMASLNDTWQWDGERWTQVQDIGPPARASAAMTIDTQRAVAVLFGGTAPNIGFGDTWETAAEVKALAPAPAAGQPGLIANFTAQLVGAFDQVLSLRVVLTAPQPVAVNGLVRVGAPGGTFLKNWIIPAGAGDLSFNADPQGITTGSVLFAELDGQFVQATVTT